MKRRIFLEDHPPVQENLLLVVALPFAIAVIASVALSLILW